MIRKGFKAGGISSLQLKPDCAESGESVPPTLTSIPTTRPSSERSSARAKRAAFSAKTEGAGLRSKRLGQKPRAKSLPTLRKEAWAAFSRFVRYGPGKETLACVCCGIHYPPNELHAGHFVHCSKQSELSYDTRNIHPQCRQCNFYGMQGEAMIHYTRFMQQTYGPQIVDELLAMKHAKKYLKRADLEEIIANYSKAINL